MKHYSRADLSRIRSGVAGGDVVTLTRHLAECSDCAAMAEEEALRDDRIAFLRAAFEDIPEHPGDDALAAYVDGIRREDVSEHLQHCAGCRAEVDDLRRWTIKPARWPVRAAWLAAAAAAVIVVTTVVRRGEPDAVSAPPGRITTAAPLPGAAAPEPPRARSEWDALVEQVRATGRLPLSVEILDLGAFDTFRGANDRDAPAVLSPAGTAIEEDRPEFRWEAIRDATYGVTVIEGTTVVAQSDPLQVTRWRPKRPLARGKTYSWQVATESLVLPAPPAPPALFRVLTAAEQAELERARRERPGEHLLLAVLYARAGVIGAARRELELHQAQTRDPLAGKLLRQLPG